MAALGIGISVLTVIGAWAFFIFPAVNVHAVNVLDWRTSRSEKAAHTGFTEKPTKYGIVYDGLLVLHYQTDKNPKGCTGKYSTG
jgi:hypothetical protein